MHAPDDRPTMAADPGDDLPARDGGPHDDRHPTIGSPPDDPPDGRWMTFAELARSRGISRDSAIALVRRKRWRRQRDNRGHTLALVPDDGPELRRPIAASQDDNRHDDTPDDRGAASFHARALAALEGALEALQEGHKAEVSALQTTHAGEVRVLGSQLAEAQSQADQARAEAVAAQGRVERLEAEQRAWWARGRLRRVWAAWRGE